MFARRRRFAFNVIERVEAKTNSVGDGSVHFLAYSADKILPALATRAGGEPVGLPE